jgi:hypothetical protein
MRYWFLLGIIFFSVFSNGQDKRALLIGINQYAPPKGYKSPMPSFRSGFKNLSGPVNDVRAFQSVLLSRFGFIQKNIDTLINTGATRKAILTALNSLLTKCQQGDVAFFMYAGHGSRVINTLSSEPDKRDESIVPADTYIPGVEDIRDKELAAIFNQFIDKGIKLTVFFDCCHSGSLARGPFDGTVARFIPDAGYDAKDNSNPMPPEARPEGNFLFIAAAQNDEAAREKLFDSGVTFGGFTYSFLAAIEQQSINASVTSIFSGARAILKSHSLVQEPVIAASDKRLEQTFLGIEKGTLLDKVQIPIIDKSLMQVTLQGGFAVGLQPGTELCKIVEKDTVAMYIVDKILGVNKAVATFKKGNAAKVNAGDMMFVTNWVFDKQPLIKIYIPQKNLPFEQVLKVASIGADIRQSNRVKWLNVLSQGEPFTTLFYDGNTLKINANGKEIGAPSPLSAAAITKLIPLDSALYFEVPVPTPLAEVFKAQLSTNKNIAITSNMSEAHYMLFGTIDSIGLPAYGLRKVQAAFADSISSLPLHTSLFTLKSIEKNELTTLVNFLVDKSMKLSKIRGWLNLAPPTEGLAQFPYHIELINRTTGKVYEQPFVKVGDKVDCFLVFDSLFDVASLARKFVYVFIIDADGKMVLGYPRGVDGNQVNQFPKKDNKGKIVVREKIFGGTIGEPAGIDNYFILATEEAIPNHTAIFSQIGVRAAPTDKNPLANLLNMGNEAGTRNLNTTPANWTLFKLQVTSVK